jgi:hypothetical protein
MSEEDVILRMQREINLTRETARLIGITQPDLNHLRDSFRVAGAARAVLGRELALFGPGSGLLRVMDEWRVAAAQISKLHLAYPTGLSDQIRDITAQSATIANAYERTLGPLQEAIHDAALRFDKQIKLHEEASRGIAAASDTWTRHIAEVSKQFAEIGRWSVGVPEAALRLWPEKALVNRSVILEDCIRNSAALEILSSSALVPERRFDPAALRAIGNFVHDHSDIVRRLPPQLPETKQKEDAGIHSKSRDEEIGAKLEESLADFDERLVQLRREAWRSLSGGIGGARLAMNGIREIFTEILHKLAPDGPVQAGPLWQNRPDKNDGRITRRMRLVHVVGEERADELDAALQFDESVRRTQKFVHSFAADPELVRVQMAQLENWIYVLIVFGRQRGG